MSELHCKPYPTRASVETLFAPLPSTTDPERIITRYTEYAYYRSRLDEQFSVDGELSDRLNILYWYLGGYAAARAAQVPLSKEQIGFLNTSVPVVGVDSALSVAAYSFVSKELPACDLKDPDEVREALYWWCIERSPKIARGGELVTRAQVRKLRYSADEPYRVPLNYFVRRFHGMDSSLSSQLDLDREAHRATLLCLLILRCAGNPQLARYLPRGSISELLRTESGKAESTLESILSLTLGGSETHSLFASVKRSVEKAGFSLERNVSSAYENTHVGLCLTEEPSIKPGLADGVAVIGPRKATSGLGQATRLSIDVLENAGLDVSTVEFGMDNPAPIGFASDVKARPLRTPHKINLLHLNAESIPLAFAYLPRSIFESSYNIGYFFWELDRLPKCHLLALDLLDEIWVSSEYNRETYAKYSALPVTNVGMAVEALPEPSKVSPEAFGLKSGDFAFLTVFDSFSFIERKNPLAVIRAFSEAFPSKSQSRAKLLIKTQNRSRVHDPHQVRIWQQIDKAVEQDNRIHIVDETLTYRELLGLKSICQCYVSLHRSEGWGFGMIEAMQLGIPVIATGYSGNMEFCRPETCFLVDYEMTGPHPGEYIFVEHGSRWAEPSISCAAAHMQTVFAENELVAARVAAASQLIADSFSVSAIAKRYGARIQEIDTIIANAQQGL